MWDLIVSVPDHYLSFYFDWVWNHVKCLGHDTSVRQHYKSEH